MLERVLARVDAPPSEAATEPLPPELPQPSTTAAAPGGSSGIPAKRQPVARTCVVRREVVARVAEGAGPDFGVEVHRCIRVEHAAARLAGHGVVFNNLRQGGGRHTSCRVCGGIECGSTSHQQQQAAAADRQGCSILQPVIKRSAGIWLHLVSTADSRTAGPTQRLQPGSMHHPNLRSSPKVSPPAAGWSAWRVCTACRRAPHTWLPPAGSAATHSMSCALQRRRQQVAGP